MNAEKKKFLERAGYLGASFLSAIILFALFALPFFRMDGIFSESGQHPAGDSAFVLMGKMFSVLVIPAEHTAVSDSIENLHSFAVAGGCLYWVMLFILIAAVSLTLVSLFKKKKIPKNSIAFLAMTIVSFAALIVYSLLKHQTNLFFQSYFGVGYSNYEYFSGAVPIFAVSLSAFVVSVLWEQLVIDKNVRVFGEDGRIAAISGFANRFAQRRNYSMYLHRKTDSRGSAFVPSSGSLHFEMSVGIRNAETISLGDKMPDIILKVGLPLYVDENMNAYWWRAARTRTEYLINKLSDVPDCELKISFGADKSIDKILLNTNCGLLKNKNVKEQFVIAKRESYLAEELDSLKDNGVEMRFYDGSFLKIAEPDLKIPVKDAGVSEVYWEYGGLSFSDKIIVAEKKQTEKAH